jgi:Flp pilus assembly protein TadD
MIVGGLMALAGSPAFAQSPFSTKYATGLNQLHAGQYEASISTMNSALQSLSGGAPPDPTIYVNLGWAQMRANHLDDADRSFALGRQYWSRLSPSEQQTLANDQSELKRLKSGLAKHSLPRS